MTRKEGSPKKEYIDTQGSKYSILLLLLVMTGSLYAQDRDAGLWSGIKVEKKINQWLDLRSAFEVRIHNNFSRAEKYLGEVGIQANVNKYLRAGVTYRYSYRYLPEFDWFRMHRVYSDLRFKYDWTFLSASVRFRFTVDKIPDFREEGTLEATARLRPQIDYNIRKTPLRVRGSIEYFFPIRQDQFLITEKTRYKLGLQYVFSPSVTLELSHLYQRGTYKNKTQNNFIWITGINYNF